MKVNRIKILWVSLLVVAAIILSILLSLFINKEELKETINPEVKSEQSLWREYENTFFGYSINYPSDWFLETNSENADSVTFTNPNDYQEEFTIAVADPEVEKILRGSVNVVSEEDIPVAGYVTTRIIGAESENGNLVNIAILNTGERLYYFVGGTEQFDEILKNFQINN